MKTRDILFIVFTFLVFSQIVVKLGKFADNSIDKLKLIKNNQLHLAILGDSRSNAAVSPTVITNTLEPLLQKRLYGFNFSANGTDVLHHYSFYKNHLAKHHPKILIWAPNPLHFAEGRIRNRLYLLPPTDLFFLIKAHAPLELLLDVITMGYFPAWRHKPSFDALVADYSTRIAIRFDRIFSKLTGLSLFKDRESRAYKKNPDGHEPFQVLEWADRFEAGAKQYEKDFQGYHPSDWHFRVAEQLIEATENNQTKLIILELPIAPWFQNFLKNHQGYQSWKAKITEICNQHKIKFIDHSSLDLGDDHAYGDPGHISEETAYRYSHILGVSIQEAIHDL